MTIFVNTENIFSLSKEYLIDVRSNLIMLIIHTPKAIVPANDCPTTLFFLLLLAFTILYAAFMSTIASLLFIISAVALDIIFSPFNILQSLH